VTRDVVESEQWKCDCPAKSDFGPADCGRFFVHGAHRERVWPWIEQRVHRVLAEKIVSPAWRDRVSAVLATQATCRTVGLRGRDFANPVHPARMPPHQPIDTIECHAAGGSSKSSGTFDTLSGELRRNGHHREFQGISPESAGLMSMSFGHPDVLELSHSLAQHHLSRLRNKSTRPAEFRQHVGVLATLLASEVTRNLPLSPVNVETPLEVAPCRQLTVRIAVVPILRAGLGMVTPLVDLIPDLEVWHLGLYRDEETAQPVHYYDKLPAENPPEIAIVADPMLATGGSASLAIAALKRWNVKTIMMMAIIAAPEGIRKLIADHPGTRIYTCAVDRALNDRKYIVPGLGDAGDRIFNT
jgi:uracil phosphoribosyltransferase